MEKSSKMKKREPSVKTRHRSDAVASRKEVAKRIAKLKTDIDIAQALTKKDLESSKFNDEIKRLLQSIYPEEDQETKCYTCLDGCMAVAFKELQAFSESYPGTRNAPTNKQDTLERLRNNIPKTCKKVCTVKCKEVNVILQLSEEVNEQIEKITEEKQKRKKPKEKKKKKGGGGRQLKKKKVGGEKKEKSRRREATKNEKTGGNYNLKF